MIKSLLKLLLILVVGVLVYNYFLGTEEEKETAREVFGKVKDVGVAVKDLIQSEKEKFDKGKYDKALDKIGGLFEDLKQKAKDIDGNYLDRISQLEDKRRDLEDRLNSLNHDQPDQYDDMQEKGDSTEKTKIRDDLEKLMEETERIMEDMKRDSQ